MTYIVQDAPDCLAVDTSWPVSPWLAKQIAAENIGGQPIAGVGQYVGLHRNGAGDITPERLQGILEAGLGCWLIQHCLNPGWVASEALGRELGAAARANAMAVGYLEGAHLELDLEGCSSSQQPVVDFVGAWCDQVKDAFQPLLYVGYSAGLNSWELYECLHDVHAYCSDAGPRSVDSRGFVMKQRPQCKLCGIPVDPNDVHADELGGRLRWMVRA